MPSTKAGKGTGGIKWLILSDFVQVSYRLKLQQPEQALPGTPSESLCVDFAERKELATRPQWRFCYDDEAAASTYLSYVEPPLTSQSWLLDSHLWNSCLVNGYTFSTLR